MTTPIPTTAAEALLARMKAQGIDYLSCPTPLAEAFRMVREEKRQALLELTVSY